MEIKRATIEDLDLLAPLFDGYRQFYHQAPDSAVARRFLRERLSRGESVIFLAFEREGDREIGLGFTQLYPSFSSVSAFPMLILSDLFVAPGARGKGVGRALMDRARDHGSEAGARQIFLQTAHDNTPAQALYESLGYQLDTTYRVYELDL